MPANIISVIGARPQFIKAAPVSRAFLAADRVSERIVHTGQHFDDNMSAVFFEELAIPKPDRHLDIHGGSHGVMTGRMLEAVEQILIDEKPDAVLVYGDTNTTLAGALSAAKLHIPIFHIEAGLRSFNRRMPEEINRVLTDHLSTLLLCPTQEAVKNLAQEGITDGVYHTGDVMYDATLYAREEALKTSTILNELDLKPEGYALATMHRAENTDDPARFHQMLSILEQAAQNTPVVFPVHPRTRALLDKLDGQIKGLLLIEPIGYFDIHRLLANAVAVYTDSGGLQKEAYFHRIPCVTLRDETEWPETIEAGWNRLWREETYKQPRKDIDDFGDGRAAEYIVKIICDFFE